MITKVKETIQKYSLIKKADSVLLAVSGGPDSVCMANIFKELQKDFNLRMGLAYFHHGIRKAADQELKFVRQLSLDMKVPFYWQKEDIPEIKKERKTSLEEIARLERYNFLIQIARKNDYFKVAVAHNKDDQVETFLHRLIRGAGLKGLRSISPVLEMQGIKIIRPLIECSRQEIETHLKELDIHPCIDQSNYEIRFTRNKIRHKLIPYITGEFNPNIKEVIYNTVENIQAAYDFIEDKIEDEFKRCVKKNDSYVKININRFKRFHPYLKKEIIRKAINVVKGNLRRFEYSHWKEIEALILKRPLNSIVDLPQDICVKKIKNWILIGRRKENEP